MIRFLSQIQKHVRMAALAFTFLGLLAPLMLEAATPESQPASNPAAPPKNFLEKIDVEMYLSSGQELKGTINRIGSKGNYFYIRAGKENTKVFPVNILNWKLIFEESDKKFLNSLPDNQAPLLLGKELLNKNLPSFAKSIFEKTQALDAKLQPQIAAAYKTSKANYPLPKTLGGDYEPTTYFLTGSRQIVENNMTKAKEWSEQMKKIAPTTHLVETDHFLIYSAWPKADDKHIEKIYEKLYDALCKQFLIPKEQNIWLGKLPVYAFWESGHYGTFALNVCNTSANMARNSAGFAGRRGAFQFVVLSPVTRPGRSKKNARQWFFELLTHESTHAFMYRYISQEGIPSWLNEGIAETISSMLVPKGSTKYKLSSTHSAVKKGSFPETEALFNERGNIPLESFYYGASQSLVKFLISKDKSAFIRFVRLIKEGKPSEEALKETFKMDYDQLYQAWVKAVR